MKVGDVIYGWFLIEEIKPAEFLPDIFVTLVGKNIFTDARRELAVEKEVANANSIED